MSNREKIKHLVNQIGDIADQEGWLRQEAMLLLQERLEKYQPLELAPYTTNHDAPPLGGGRVVPVVDVVMQS